MNERVLYNKVSSNSKKEKNWNHRFVLDKIPKFDAYKDVNYLSLGLLKSKIRYEQRIKREQANSKYAGRIYSSLYVKPKSSSRVKKVFGSSQKSLDKTSRNRDLSMRISLNKDFSIKKNKKTLNHYLYQGTLTGQNMAGSYLFNYMPDYKNKDINQNLREIICKEDKEISKEYESIKELWEKLGVTQSYIDKFDFVINTKSNNRDSILQMLNGEKRQMKKFRIELMKVISEIAKRENKINDLKKFIFAYGKVKKINRENEDNENMNELRTKNIGEVNRELIENDIHECLKSLRLRTINTVNLIRKFNTAYYNLFNNKISLKFIKSKYGYDDKYLAKVKNDLDFLKDSEINTLYHFSEKGGDPFLLFISDKCAEPSDLLRYKVLPITNEVLAIVRTYMFSLEEEEVFLKIKSRDIQNPNQSQFFRTNINNNNLYNTMNNRVITSYNSKIKKPFNKALNNNVGGVGNNNKLSSNNVNKNDAQNVEEKNEELPINLENNVELKIDNLYQIPRMTSKQLIRHLKKYGKMKKELFPPINKDLIKEEVQKNFFQKIEDRMGEVEREFNIKMDENFKKEQKKLEEEELRLKEEKEYIEKMKIKEEEERKRKEEKYLQLEKERNKRKKNDKRRREDSEKIAKKDNDIFLRDMEIKFMKNVKDKFKKENDIQFENKKVVIEEMEEKDKEKKEEIQKIKYADYKELKEAGYPIYLSSEENRSGTEELSENNYKSKVDEENEEESDNKSSKKNEKSSKNEENSKKEDENESEENEESESKTKTKKSKSKKKDGSSDNEEEENDEKEDNSDSN